MGRCENVSLQPVGPWMGCPYTDLGAEGCCCSLNALLHQDILILELCNRNHLHKYRDNSAQYNWWWLKISRNRIYWSLILKELLCHCNCTYMDCLDPESFKLPCVWNVETEKTKVVLPQIPVASWFIACYGATLYVEINRNYLHGANFGKFKEMSFSLWSKVKWHWLLIKWLWHSAFRWQCLVLSVLSWLLTFLKHFPDTCHHTLVACCSCHL